MSIRIPSAPLVSWNNGPTKDAILSFVARVTKAGSPDFVPPEQRLTVFDNDGTLWCEKPLPVELVFILQRLAEMARENPALRERQPWKAARENDHGWLGGAITKHYQGDDSDVTILLGGVLRAFAGMKVETYEAVADLFLHSARHPTLGRYFFECSYEPMVELLCYLEYNGFTNYIASGGDRDFMRSITQEVYGIPPERVIGSTTALRYKDGKRGGAVIYKSEPDVFDDGPTKPVRFWSRTGRRPIFAVGNSNGDIPMLRFCADGSYPCFRLLVSHDDDKREFAYQSGSEELLARARKERWTVASIKNDWRIVFATAASARTAAS